MLKVDLLLLKWELVELLRNRAMLFWAIIFPILLFVVLVAAFGGAKTLGEVRIAVIDRDRSASSGLFTDTLHSAFGNDDAVSARWRNDPAQADLRITVPEGFGAAVVRRAPAVVRVEFEGDEGVAQRAAARIVAGAAAKFELAARQTPISVRTEFIAAGNAKPALRYESFLLAGVVVMSMLSVCLMGIVVPLVARREYGVMRALQSLPLSRGQYMGAFMVSRVIICVLGACIMIAGLATLYHLDIVYTVPMLLEAVGSLVLVSTVYAALGLLIAARLKTIASATALASICYFPLVFIGNLTIPLSNLPPQLRVLADYLPSAEGAGLLRQVLFSAGGSGQGLQAVLVIGLTGAVACVLARLLFVWSYD
jgi:ABC-type multidrug transport system permease subunit